MVPRARIGDSTGWVIRCLGMDMKIRCVRSRGCVRFLGRGVEVP